MFPFSGGGIPLRFRDGGLRSVQRLHRPKLRRALSPRWRARAPRSRSWRARGPWSGSPGLDHLRAGGGQDGAQDRQAATWQGQPHVPDLAVLLVDGHGNYRDIESLSSMRSSHYWFRMRKSCDRYFDYYSITNNWKEYTAVFGQRIRTLFCISDFLDSLINIFISKNFTSSLFLEHCILQVWERDVFKVKYLSRHNFLCAIFEHC